MATTLTPEQMKQFARNHFEDFVNRRNSAVIRKNMTPDFFDHDGPGGKPTGVDGDEQMMLNMCKVMTDLHLTIEEMIAEGDKVVCRNIWRWADASARRCSYTVLCFDASRATRFPSDGPRSRPRPKEPHGRPRSKLLTSWRANFETRPRLCRRTPTITLPLTTFCIQYRIALAAAPTACRCRWLFRSARSAAQGIRPPVPKSAPTPASAEDHNRR